MKIGKCIGDIARESGIDRLIDDPGCPAVFLAAILRVDSRFPTAGQFPGRIEGIGCFKHLISLLSFIPAAGALGSGFMCLHCLVAIGVNEGALMPRTPQKTADRSLLSPHCRLVRRFAGGEPATISALG